MHNLRGHPTLIFFSFFAILYKFLQMLSKKAEKKLIKNFFFFFFLEILIFFFMAKYSESFIRKIGISVHTGKKLTKLILKNVAFCMV